MGCCDTGICSCGSVCQCEPRGEVDRTSHARIRTLEERQRGVTKELELLRGEVRDLLARPRST